MRPRVARVLVWCDRPEGVRRAAALFADGLGFRELAAPATRARHPLLPAARETFSAAVTDGRTTLEFASIGWIARLRAARKLAPAAQVIAVCVEGVDSPSLVQCRPNVTESALMLQPLAWLADPVIHPVVLYDEQITATGPDHAHSARPDATDAPEPHQAHVKEIVLGEHDDHFVSSTAVLRSLASDSILPGLLTFSRETDCNGLCPALRVRPATASSLVVRAPDTLDARWAEAQQVSLTPLAIRAIQAGGRVDACISDPLLAGLDLRVSFTDNFESRFVEPPECFLSDRAVTFDRTDMGSMTCSSVNGMEMKARFSRLPRKAILALGHRSRPHLMP